jgi:hypothetical protein
MRRRFVQLWSARAHQVVIMRLLSDTLPRRAASFSDAPHAATALGLHDDQGEPCVHTGTLVTSACGKADRCVCAPRAAGPQAHL